MENGKTTEITNMWQFLANYAQKHGGLVFGVLSTIAIWILIAQPELERNAVQNQVLREALNELKKQTEDQKEIAEHLKTTSMILDKITIKLEDN